MSEQSANPGAPNPHKDLVKPEDIQRVAFLDGAAKAKYSQVFRGFWQMLNTKPPGSPEYKHAFEQLTSASNKLRSMAVEHRKRLQAQGQGGQGAQQQQQQQQQQAQSAGQPSNAHPGQQAQQANGQQAAARPTASQFSQAIIKHVKEYPYLLPPPMVVGTPEAEAKIKELRTSYATHLQKQETTSNQLKQIESIIQQTRAKGQDIPPQLLQKKAEIENQFRASQVWVENFKNSQNALKQAREGAAKAGQTEAQAPQVKTEPAAAPNRPPTATQQQTPTSQAANTPLQVQTANIRTEAGRSTQSPATAQLQGPQHNQPPTPTTQPSQQQNQQQPTPINGNMAFNHAQMMRPGMNQMQQASPQTNGPPVPLSHSAAISNAQRSYSERQAGTPNQPTSPHNLNRGERETQSHPKMPIPKNINIPPPAPVAVTPGRPTMGGSSNSAAPGMMSQPVLNKLPQYMLEGDGERVLSKKKLDELVRQVTGAGDNATGDSLSPEVEETMLQLADDFVDEIITQACRLSKLRESHQLDIRDLQLVLERKYNIRIPGYASDEIRTVRKLHPAPGWNEKMKALQAAKIMNGKTDV